jgi:hypothetical protein
VTTRYRYPIKRSPKSDPQQYRVYRMENEAIGARKYMSMDPKTTVQLARSVCRHYRVPVVKLEWVNLGKWAAEWEGRVIRLSTKKKTSRDILTFTHELAHHVHYWLSEGASEEQQSHGPEFMGCHMSVLDTCRVIPVVGMRAVCEAWNVRFMDPGTHNSLKTLKRIVSNGRRSPKY